MNAAALTQSTRRGPALVLTGLALALSWFSDIHPEGSEPSGAVADYCDTPEAVTPRSSPEAKPRLVRLSVRGHVAKPGIYRVEVPISVDRLLDLVGGPTNQAVTNLVLVRRMVRDLDASERQQLSPVLRDVSESARVSVICGWERFRELSARLVDGNAIQVLSSDEIDELRGFRHPPPSQ